ncbi:hypothetical protein TPA0909_60430 [Streptomyces albus]|nr:hypothetical protein TPA0909_60430 [Streptomyces albus]
MNDAPPSAFSYACIDCDRTPPKDPVLVGEIHSATGPGGRVYRCATCPDPTWRPPPPSRQPRTWN